MEDFNQKLDDIIGRLDSLASAQAKTEAHIKSLERRGEDESEVSFKNTSIVPNRNPLSVDSLKQSSSGFSSIDTERLQAEFRVLADSYSKIKLPADIQFHGSRAGIKGSDREVASALFNCTKYVLTTLKILSSMVTNSERPGYSADEQINEIYTCMLSVVRYAQEEHCGLVVHGKLGPKGQEFFKDICSQTSAFPPHMIERFQQAAMFTATQQQIEQSQGPVNHKQKFQHQQQRFSFNQNNTPWQGGRG